MGIRESLGEVPGGGPLISGPCPKQSGSLEVSSTGMTILFSGPPFKGFPARGLGASRLGLQWLCKVRPFQVTSFPTRMAISSSSGSYSSTRAGRLGEYLSHSAD